MVVIGFSTAVHEYISKQEKEKLQLSTEEQRRLIFDGFGFIDLLPNLFEGTNIPALKYINRGDKKQLAIYIHKFIKAFIDNQIHVTVVSRGPQGPDDEKFRSTYIKSMFKSLKFSKQFYKEGVATDLNKFRCKVFLKFTNFIRNEVLNVLSQQYPQYLTIVKCPTEKSPYLLELVKKEPSSIIVSNNTDLLLAFHGSQDIALCRFNDLSLKHRKNAEKDVFDIFTKVVKSSDVVKYLISKWKLENEKEFNLTLSLMKNDYTDEADVHNFIGEDLYNFEKAASFVREKVDLLKEDPSITMDTIVDAVIEKAYKDNAKAIDNSKHAFHSFEEGTIKSEPLIDLNDDKAFAEALLPEYIQKRNDREALQKLKSSDLLGSFIRLAYTFFNCEPVDILSCSTDTFSPNELWYSMKCKIEEIIFLSNASPLRINPEYKSKKFNIDFYGKLEENLIEIKSSHQEKGTYLTNGNEKIYSFARDYAKHETNDPRKSFLKLWIPENSLKSADDYEQVLKTIPAVYHPFVLVLPQLYYLLSARDPKPKVDFLFLNEAIFASFFLDEPMHSADEVTKLGSIKDIYPNEMADLNNFVNVNYYRYHSYLEEGLIQYLNSSSALGCFNDSFCDFASTILVNGTYSAYTYSMLSKDPTAEALLKLIPESRHAVYKATKEGIRSLCTNEINQHFWIEDATNLLNTKSIFASNVPFSMKAADFYKLFEGISLKKVYLKSADSGTGHVGRGTLEFENEESMIKALFFNRYRFDNRYIHLTPSISSSKQEVARESPKTTTPTGSNAASQWTRQTASTRGGKPRGRGGRGGSSRSSGSTTTSRALPTHNEPVTELVVDNKWDVLLNDTDE
jgi:hypothetical protein